MNANELRLGNIIHLDNRVTTAYNIVITARFFASLAGSRAQQELDTTGQEINAYYSGIPLTPEILEKCDFKFIHETQSWVGPKGEVFVREGGNYVFEKYGDTPQTQIVLQSLHHFQNVYYFTTGEELNINL